MDELLEFGRFARSRKTIARRIIGSLQTPLRSIMAPTDTIGTAAVNVQCPVNGNFRNQNGIGPRKCDSRTHSGGVQKDNPFPTTWIGRWDDFELNSFVLHSRSLKNVVST